MHAGRKACTPHETPGCETSWAALLCGSVEVLMRTMLAPIHDNVRERERCTREAVDFSDLQEGRSSDRSVARSVHLPRTPLSEYTVILCFPFASRFRASSPSRTLFKRYSALSDPPCHTTGMSRSLSISIFFKQRGGSASIGGSGSSSIGWKTEMMEQNKVGMLSG